MNFEFTMLFYSNRQKMKRRTVVLLAMSAALVIGAAYAVAIIRRGFSATDEPSSFEKAVARAVRNLGIPSRARAEKNPWPATMENIRQAGEIFAARCAGCHGADGRGQTHIGQNLYPKPPDLCAARTQSLNDGEIHYIIQNGVRLTGMPAWGNPHDQLGDESWKLVLFIRHLQQPAAAEKAEVTNALSTAHYVGSVSCEKCHAEIYQHWKKTPMANVVRDPAEHPEAIIPDLSTNPFAKFTKEQVALVYGSIWKQRYFTKIGDDYFPEPAQWDVTHRVWKPYFVPVTNADWWTPFYPPDNMKRPTGPTCDGCHSVDYDIQTKRVVEWNVGCERCHGPGSEHVAHPVRGNIFNPAHADYVSANDSCIQCHSQGRPAQNPIEGKYYDWPVGYRVGLPLREFWQLEDHKLGETSFTHFPDGTGHKNRMQGNDFVQSQMYRHGVTCFTCHDAHGTENYAQLRKPADKLCLDCHVPMSVNGPRTATIEEHTHHKTGTPGGQCMDCHMPKIETTLGDVKVRAHTFAFITPTMTDRYGIPNACTSCHAGKSTAWATDALSHWSERSPWRLQ
jgi:predicted CXXCH cytochrome family protein